MWRWSELLPVRGWNRVIHLGEGDTPLLSQPRLGKTLGVPHLATKAEGLNPTGLQGTQDGCGGLPGLPEPPVVDPADFDLEALVDQIRQMRE